VNRTLEHEIGAPLAQIACASTEVVDQFNSRAIDKSVSGQVALQDKVIIAAFGPQSDKSKRHNLWLEIAGRESVTSLAEDDLAAACYPRLRDRTVRAAALPAPSLVCTSR
jgi:hypothetical protein